VFALKRQFIRSCPLVIAPSRTRAEALKRFYTLLVDPQVVYNSPRKDVTAPDEQWRRRLGIAETTPIVVYAGGFGQDRRVPELVESVAFWPKESALVMAGYGRAGTVERLREVAERAGVAGRVHFAGHLPSIFGLVREAQIGVSFFPADTPHRNGRFRGMASNKIFEYLAMGKPAIITANPETLEFMDRFQCGACVADHSPRGIAETVCALLTNPDRLARAAENARRAHEEETHFEKRYSGAESFLSSLCSPSASSRKQERD
jgi:glycosyltransferase involved in cell wall biosynthesis